MLKVIKYNGFALMYASNRLKNDFNFMLEATNLYDDIFIL